MTFGVELMTFGAEIMTFGAEIFFHGMVRLCLICICLWTL